MYAGSGEEGEVSGGGGKMTPLSARIPSIKLR